MHYENHDSDELNKNVGAWLKAHSHRDAPLLPGAEPQNSIAGRGMNYSDAGTSLKRRLIL